MTSIGESYLAALNENNPSFIKGAHLSGSVFFIATKRRATSRGRLRPTADETISLLLDLRNLILHVVIIESQ
jgi:hypothetical protein